MHVFKLYKIIRTRKILKTLKNRREKMSVRVNASMSKIMCMSIIVGVCTYATHANGRSLSKTHNFD